MAKKSKNKARGAQKPAAAESAKAAQPADAVVFDFDDTHFVDVQLEAPADDASSAHEIALQDPVDGFATDEANGAPVDAVHADESDADAAPDANGDDEPEQVAVAIAPPAPAFDLAAVEVFDSDMGSNPDDIRGVLIQLANARLLLPNATIAEVLSYAEPDAIEDTPDWLLGRIRWRGWQLPLIAFSQLAGISSERGGLGSKVVVLKALGGGKTPYFAVLTQGFPRLVTVSRSALVVDETRTDLPTAILAHVTLNRDDAYLPNLEQVEQMIAEALAHAA